MVGDRKNVLSGTLTPSSRRTASTSSNALSELPPAAKKSSRTPTGDRPRTRSQIVVTRSSNESRGATDPAAASAAGSGNCLRSTLPFGVSGIRSRPTSTAGTMYCGRCSRRNARSPGSSGSSRQET